MSQEAGHQWDINEQPNLYTDFNENSWDAVRHFESSIWPSKRTVATAARSHSMTQCHLRSSHTLVSYSIVGIFFPSPIVQVSESPDSREFKQNDNQCEMPKCYQGNVILIKQRCFQTPSSSHSVTTCCCKDLGKRLWNQGRSNLEIPWDAENLFMASCVRKMFPFQVGHQYCGQFLLS